jgi:hypothetical protein
LASVEFLGSGVSYLLFSEFQDSVTHLVESCINRLEDFGIFNTLLQQEWTEITSTQGEEFDFCVAAASMGVDPYSIDGMSSDTIVSIAERLPPSLLGEFFAATEVTSLAGHSESISAAIESTRRARTESSRLKLLTGAFVPDGKTSSSAWVGGYKVARHFRRAIGLDGQPLESLKVISDALTLAPKELDRFIFSSESP